MPVAIARTCPHCGTTFNAQRQDNIFCSRQHLHKFNYWKRSKHDNAPRSAKLIEAYRLHMLQKTQETQVQ